MTSDAATVQPSSPGIYDKLRDTAHHTVWFGVSSVLGRSLNFLLLPVYTRYLTGDEYGALSLLLVLQTFTSILPNSILIFPLFRSYHDYDESDQRNRSLVVSTSFWLIAVVALLICTTGWLLSAPISAWIILSRDYSSSVQLVFLACFAECLGLPSFSVFRAKKRSKAYALVATVSMLVQAFISVILVVRFGYGVRGVMIGIVIGIALRTLIGIIMIPETLSLRVSLHEAKKMLLYGIPLLPGNLLNYFNRSSDRIFLTRYLDLAAQGVFSVGLRFAQVISILVFQPFNFIRPAAIFSSEKDADAGRFYAKMVTYLILLSLFLTLGVSAFAPEALRLMTPKSYWNVWPVIPILCLSYLFDGLRLSLSPGLLLKRNTTLMSVADAIGTAANIGLMILLVPAFHALGAAIAVSITFLIVCIALLIFNFWYLPVPWEWVRIIKLFLSASLLYFLALCLPDHSLLLSLLLKSVLCLSFPLILLALGFYQASERRRISSIFDTLLRRVHLR